MLMNSASRGEVCGATMYFLNSVLIACGGEENVEMHEIDFDLAWHGGGSRIGLQHSCSTPTTLTLLKLLFHPWREKYLV